MTRKQFRLCRISLIVFLVSAIISYLLIAHYRETFRQIPKAFSGDFSSDVGRLTFVSEKDGELVANLSLNEDPDLVYELYFIQLQENVYQYLNKYLDSPPDWIAVLLSKNQVVLFRNGVLIGSFVRAS